MIHASMRQQGHLGIEGLCALAGVTRSGYYRHWQASAPRQEETALRHAIQVLSLTDRGIGYRPVTIMLKRQGWVVNHKRMERLRKSPFRPATTNSRHRFEVYPNLARKLIPTTVNQLWVADIAYVRLAEEFVYLAVVLDAYSRRVIGWALADHLRAELALEGLEMALATREVIPGGLVHHSDRGVQYACGDYVQRLKAAGIQPSMNRAGCPWDNAMAESFMATLKRDKVNGQAYRDEAHARSSIGQFVEEVYNRQRLHSALDYLAPVDFETAQRSERRLPHAASAAPIVDTGDTTVCV
jgi:transposase InsO family protein